jgi:dimethylargininase
LKVFDFDRAIVRSPAPSVTDGLRAGDHDGPTYDGVVAEHAAYVAVLERAGLAITTLPPLDEYPDSIFVEDAALVFPEGAILLRPGAPSRAGEPAAMRPTLDQRFDRVLDLSGGAVDGGDVLVTPGEVLIGLSGRTDLRGARALAGRLAELGYRARIVAAPPGVLHFKSGCSLLDEETVLVTQSLDNGEIFDGLGRLQVAAGEEPAANALRLNDFILIADGYPRTRELIEARGLATLAVPVSEIAKLDAGLSCMSLRWRAVGTLGKGRQNG